MSVTFGASSGGRGPFYREGFAALVLSMLCGCGVFRSPSTDIKPASSEVGSTTTTKVRVIPRAPEKPPCDSPSSSD